MREKQAWTEFFLITKTLRITDLYYFHSKAVHRTSHLELFHFNGPKLQFIVLAFKPLVHMI